VSAAADAWGPDDIKVEGALQGLMKVRIARPPPPGRTKLCVFLGGGAPTCVYNSQ
jgi:hypothetical protein